MIINVHLECKQSTLQHWLYNFNSILGYLMHDVFDFVNLI
jgi:hypothetical protein